MTLTIKRGIPRRTCFALEFTPPAQHEPYLTVASFVDDNAEFMRSSLLDNAPRMFKVHLSVEIQFNHATNLDEQKKWHISTAAQQGNRETLVDYFTSQAAILDEKIANYSTLGSGWRIESLLKVSLTVPNILNYVDSPAMASFQHTQ